mgnify:CR=1 FL=1
MVNDTKSPAFTLFLNPPPVIVTVDIPGAVPDFGVIFTLPKAIFVNCLTSALNVPTPTALWIDSTAPIECAVIAVAILLSSTPLKINFSPGENDPLEL